MWVCTEFGGGGDTRQYSPRQERGRGEGDLEKEKKQGWILRRKEKGVRREGEWIAGMEDRRRINDRRKIDKMRDRKRQRQRG